MKGKQDSHIITDYKPRSVKVNVTNPNQHHNYMITDFFTNIDQVDSTPSKPSMRKNFMNSIWLKFWAKFGIWYPELWMVMILVGLISAATAFGVEYSGSTLHAAKVAFSNQTDDVYLNWFIWVVYSLIYGFIAVSVGAWISADAEGSGIPELKSILSGIQFRQYLLPKTLLAKVIGLIAATGAGFSIGKEGPFVHISCIIANNLMRLRCFRVLKDNATLKQQVLAAAVAAGVVATFGAPVGGVLFSIEVTATFYAVNNLFRGLFCGIWCILFYSALHMTEINGLLSVNEHGEVGMGLEILVFIFLGVIWSFLGSFFVYCVSKLVLLRKFSGIFWFKNRYTYAMTAVVICAFISFPTAYLQQGNKAILSQLLSTDDLSFHKNDDWEDPSEWANLAIFSVAKFVMTAISVTSPIPCGVFTPVFTMGASIGRLVGWIVDGFVGTEYAGVYAIVGAAAVTASVTHTVSVAVIVFELTGQISYMIPLLIAVLISVTISQGLTMSIYDVMLDFKSLPYLPALRKQETYQQKAANIMETDFDRLNKNSTLRDLSLIIEKNPHVSKIAIVDEDQMMFGTVSIKNTGKFLQRKYNETLPNLHQRAQIELQAYFHRLSYITEIEFDHPFIDYDKDVLCDMVQNHELSRILSDFISKNIDDDYLRNMDLREEENEVMEFWSTPINFKDPELFLDRAPLCVQKNASLSKVHFMFQMLGLTQLFITQRGKLCGMINRDSFIKYKH